MAERPDPNGLDKALRRYWDMIKVSEKGKAKVEVEKVVKEIISRVEAKDSRFKLGLEYRGSMYEKVKIKEADEFDFDLTITQLTIEEAPKGRPPNTPSEYTTYQLRPALQETWKNLADPEGKLLSAERVVQAFSSLVRQTIKDLNESEKFDYHFDFKTNHPAVTVIFKKDGETVYDVDLAPVIEVKKWPENLTVGWERRKKKGWPSEELVTKLKQSTVYLVPKLYRDQNHDKRDFLWRYAFNKGEKKLLTDKDSTIANSCRREVVCILKGFLSDFEWPGLRSYHMKTIMLHEFESYGKSEKWQKSEEAERVLSAVRRLKSCLMPNPPKCQHYFLTDVNILEGINEQQKLQVLDKIKAFLENPQAAVTKLIEGQVSSRGKKKLAESSKDHAGMMRNFLKEVTDIAEEEKNDRLMKVCEKYNEKCLQVGIKGMKL